MKIRQTFRDDLICLGSYNDPVPGTSPQLNDVLSVFSFFFVNE